MTTTPNALIQPLHDRMPVILAADAYDLWLDPAVQTAERLVALLRPYPDDEMVAYPVSTRVNDPANDSPDLVAPHLAERTFSE